MYGKTSVVGLSASSGGLAFTGFSLAWYVIAASIFIVGGLLMIRFGRRRAAKR